jgi:hypothetical protein
MGYFADFFHALEPLIWFFIGLTIASVLVRMIRLLLSFDKGCDHRSVPQSVPLTQVEQDRIAWWGR